MFETTADLLPGPPGPALAAALASAEERPDGHRVAEVPADVEVVSRIQAWDRMIAWATAGQARAVAELARLRSAADSAGGADRPLAEQVSPYVEDELAVALRQSRGAAGARLGLALGLDELPGTADALAAGRIDPAKARAVVEATSGLPAGVATAVEARVLPQAAQQTTPQLRASLRRALITADPRDAEKRHIAAVAERRVRLSPEPHGMASLYALLPAPEALALYRCLTELAGSAQGACPPVPPSVAGGTGAVARGDAAPARPASTDGPDAHGRTLDQRRADALTYLAVTARDLSARASAAAEESAAHASVAADESAASASVAGGESAASASVAGGESAAHLSVAGGDPRSGAAAARVPLTALLRADVSIVISATTLLGLDDEPVELAGYGPIPASLARRLAGDGTWRRLLMDPATGELLECDRKAYRPSAVLDDYVRMRDGTCRFPGCRQPAARADLDHTVPHAHGGPTERENLGALCRHHHRLKTHAPGWHVRQDSEAVFAWTTPTGTTHVTTPKSGPFSPSAASPPPASSGLLASRVR